MALLKLPKFSRCICRQYLLLQVSPPESGLLWWRAQAAANMACMSGTPHLTAPADSVPSHATCFAVQASLLVGGPGTAKTSIVNQFLLRFPPDEATSKTMTFSSLTTPAIFQTAVEVRPCLHVASPRVIAFRVPGCIYCIFLPQNFQIPKYNVGLGVFTWYSLAVLQQHKKCLCSMV